MLTKVFNRFLKKYVRRQFENAYGRIVYLDLAEQSFPPALRCVLLVYRTHNPLHKPVQGFFLGLTFLYGFVYL